jgi:hypothetical protein
VDQKIAANAASKFKGGEDVGLGGRARAVVRFIQIFEFEIQTGRRRLVQRRIYTPNIRAPANCDEAGKKRRPSEATHAAGARSDYTASAFWLVLDKGMVVRRSAANRQRKYMRFEGALGFETVQFGLELPDPALGVEAAALFLQREAPEMFTERSP